MIDALFDIGRMIMAPLYFAVSWIMVQFHSLLAGIGLNPAGGVTWSLMIIGLVVVIRILLIPLFFKQIKASRGLQMLQPEIKKLQERYKNDRERQSQELMKLYRETGTNPLASCLPILAQAPIFFALFGVLNGIAYSQPRGVLTESLVREGQNATLFGAKIFDTFLAPDNGAARVVALILIVLMSATTFMTQKQLMTKNMPASAMTGTFAQQQKILLYVFPLMFAVTGVNFPIGVLLYWFTTNLWSMGQQLYVIRRLPTPGSIAAENLERKRAERARRRGEGPGEEPAAGAPSRLRALGTGSWRRSGARTPDLAQPAPGSAGATALSVTGKPTRTRWSGRGGVDSVGPPRQLGNPGPTGHASPNGRQGRAARRGSTVMGAGANAHATAPAPAPVNGTGPGANGQGGAPKRTSGQRQQPRRQSRAKRR